MCWINQGCSPHFLVLGPWCRHGICQIRTGCEEGKDLTGLTMPARHAVSFGQARRWAPALRHWRLLPNTFTIMVNGEWWLHAEARFSVDPSNSLSTCTARAIQVWGMSDTAQTGWFRWSDDDVRPPRFFTQKHTRKHAAKRAVTWSECCASLGWQARSNITGDLGALAPGGGLARVFLILLASSVAIVAFISKAPNQPFIRAVLILPSPGAKAAATPRPDLPDLFGWATVWWKRKPSQTTVRKKHWHRFLWFWLSSGCQLAPSWHSVGRVSPTIRWRLGERRRARQQETTHVYSSRTVNAVIVMPRSLQAGGVAAHPTESLGLAGGAALKFWQCCLTKKICIVAWHWSSF